MAYKELFNYLKNVGKDPSALVFEDELTGLYNRRFLLNYLQYKIAWNAPADYRVSLLMMDIDAFKLVNDTYGHDAGDQALVHVADVLKNVSADVGLPVRYGGDEFIILLPGADKAFALELGNRLLQSIHEKTFYLNDTDVEIRLTLSVGVASSPDDAESGKILIQKADTALYHAKHTGRDHMVDVANAAAQDVFPKTAIQSLENAKMAGRGKQLAQVAGALKKFSQKKNRFLIVEGADGMGKSAFLQSVRQNLASLAIGQVKVSGTPQELFRPYYLVSGLIVELMNSRGDKGKSVLDALSPSEMNLLSFVLPSVTGTDRHVPEDRKSRREKIFRFLIRFVSQLADFRPLLVFADDLHFADEASLSLFRAMMLQNHFPLFLCAAANVLQTEIDISPLQRFWQVSKEELDIQKITLTPLSDTDIAELLEQIFPALDMPADFEKELARITQGNPLFISEILSKLIHDQKIVLAGRQWTVQPFNSTYLPASLEEIITEKMVSLDEESRRILNHASIFGEFVSLSMLIGSFEGTETHVQDFLDKAKEYGIVSSELHTDDENIRFLSKRVQEIVYGNIQQEHREHLHEKIAHYQEKLFEKNLLPSAAILAWHFRKSADPGKARIYDRQLQEYSGQIFVAEEAAHYTGEGDGALQEVALDQTALRQLPHFLRSLLVAIRSIKLYPAGSKGRIDALDQVQTALDGILSDSESIRVAVDKNILTVNGETIDTTDFKSVAERICTLFSGLELNSLAISRDRNEGALEGMLEVIGFADRRKIHPRFWQQVCDERGLQGIELKQVRYTRVEEDEEGPSGMTIPALRDADTLIEAVQEIDHGLTGEELSLIPRMIGSLMGAVSKIKLYPLESSVIADAVEQVMVPLKAFLSARPFLTLTAVDMSLLVNGHKIDTLNFTTHATSFLRFLRSVHLSSITFTKNVSSSEVLLLLTTILQPQSSELDEDFWRHLSKKGTYKGILFNQSLYTVFEESHAGSEEEDSAESHADDDSHLAPDVSTAGVTEHVSDKRKEFHKEALEDTLRDLLLRNEEEAFSRLLEKTFRDYAILPSSDRESLVEVLEKVANSKEFVPPSRFLKRIAEHLKTVFRREDEAALLEHFFQLLQQIAFALLQFGDYALASWVFLALRERLRELDESESDGHQRLAQTLRSPIPAHILSGLWNDLKSSNAYQQQEAMLFLSTVDDRILPFFVDMIRNEDDLRIRQGIAKMIANMGSEAVETFKRSLVLEVGAEERVRMLDVAELISRDIHIELSYALSDEKSQVRRAALYLAERLNDEQSVDLLCDVAQTEEPGKAIPAIRALGRMKAAKEIPTLVDILSKAKEQEIQIACCQALGQIADPAGMDILIHILTAKGLLSIQKKYSDNLRAAAAFALTQMPHPRVSEVLKSLSEDKDPRIRQTARKVLMQESTRHGDNSPAEQTRLPKK